MARRRDPAPQPLDLAAFPELTAKLADIEARHEGNPAMVEFFSRHATHEHAHRDARDTACPWCDPAPPSRAFVLADDELSDEEPDELEEDC
jgi:hypothetical protein